jgi:hypothetical protein
MDFADQNWFSKLLILILWSPAIILIFSLLIVISIILGTLAIIIDLSIFIKSLLIWSITDYFKGGWGGLIKEYKNGLRN